MDELRERKASADEVTEVIMKSIGELIEKYQ
jgi:1-acyl-sn-glycerol-3-phosphate acyltransferase